MSTLETRKKDTDKKGVKGEVNERARWREERKRAHAKAENRK